MSMSVWLLLGLAFIESGDARKVHARVWRPSAAEFVFPELAHNTTLGDYLRKRQNFGIALAGGGTRGSALAHGTLRSLRAAGVLDKARYISTTSGSVWVGVQLYYQKKDSLDEFFGASLPPSKLYPDVLVGSQAGTGITRVRLSKFPKGILVDGASHMAMNSIEEMPHKEKHMPHVDDSSAQETAFELMRRCPWMSEPCSCFVNNIIPNTSLDELWNLFSSYVFMNPFGLGRTYASHCHESQHNRTLGQLGSRATVYTSKDISQNLPFHISQSAVLAPSTGFDGEPFVAFPLEQTSLYTGTPASYTGTAAKPFDGIGDAYVESFAWGGVAMEALTDAAEQVVKIDNRQDLINPGQLGELSGIATSYFADFPVARNFSRCKTNWAEKIVPHKMLWSPMSVDKNGKPLSSYRALGDAGVYDDQGHVPLLRRKVAKILMFDSSAVHDNETGSDAENLCEMTYIRAAFGQPGCLHTYYRPGSPNAKMAANFSTVFAPSEFAGFWAKVQRFHVARKPAIIRGKFTVVDNPYLGIVGGWTVEILWVLQLPVQKWRSELPESTNALLPSFFPNYLATETSSHFAMGALSQYASWLSDNYVLDALRSFLNDAVSGDSIYV